MALMGIDVGTTSCKVTVFNEIGEMIAFAQKAQKIDNPHDGWAEVNADELWNTIAYCIREASLKSPERIEAFSISSQGEGLIPLDESLHPLGPIILSYDSRSVEQTDWLEQTFGKKYFFDNGGQILSSVGSLTKILWIMQHNSLYTKKPSYYTCVGDYILIRMGIGPITDPSMASRTMMYSISEKNWNQDLIMSVGIKPDSLCEILPAGTLLGELSDEKCRELMLPQKTKVVLGGHDQPCALYGAGSKTTPIYSLGTTETLVCSLPNFHQDLFQYGLPCYPHVDGDSFITLPGNFTGGNILLWFIKYIGLDIEQEAKQTGKDPFSILSDIMMDTPSNLLVLPHFAVTGSPWNDSNSHGMIVGLRLDTTRSELVRGLLEGVAYEIYLNLKLLEKSGICVSKLNVVGGGTNSRKFLQLRADLLGKELTVSDVRQASCRGAARLAGNGIGLLNNPSDWENTGTKFVRIIPQLDNTIHYEKEFVRYKKLYSAMKSIYQEVDYNYDLLHQQ